jgi:hypothetical protein
MLHYVLLPTDHHAIATIKAPYSTAGPYIDIVDILWRQFFGATNVVDVVRIAAVNENILRVEVRQEVSDALIHRGCRHHQPYGSWFIELPYKICQ